MWKAKDSAFVVVITALLLVPVVGVSAVDRDGPEEGGSLIGVVRLTPESSNVGVPELLEKYIKEKDERAWYSIKQKIDYTYRALGNALWPVLWKYRLKDKLLAEIDAGRKLFIKANFINPRVLELTGDGSPGREGGGAYVCTDWAFVAALMRFFHDELAVRYYQMAIGDAGTLMPAHSNFLKCTPEALIEGTPHGVDEGYWAGWAFYFVRKYLSETTTPHDPKDDPLNGYSDSIEGNYVTPGQATKQGKLMVYDLNHAEEFDRGRRVAVPDGGDNHKEGLVIHKALVGDPDNMENYPGSVIVNPQILKIHSITTLTAATKNLGMGGIPMCSGQDSNVKNTDWRYAYPRDSVPAIKYRYHDKWYVVEESEEGMPLRITDKPNMGLDGTIVDVNLAIKSQVLHTLHIVDAVQIIDLDQTGTGGSTPVEEGLIFASTDPIALDLLCARYMFKNLPRDPNSPDRFARTVPIPRYDKASGAIVTDDGVDERLSRTTLFKYGAKRGLGKLICYVEGRDLTSAASSPLVSKDGHLGKIEDGKFVEIMTDHFYFHPGMTLWHMQPAVLAHAQATDQLTGSKYYEEFMALDEDKDGMIDDREFGKNGTIDGMVAPLGIGWSLIGKGQVEHGIFFINSRLLKHSNPAWNVGKIDCTNVFLDHVAFGIAFRMATDKENEGTDSFFGITFGAVDGTARWPSLQFVRYSFDMFLIYDLMYASAVAYSEKTGKPFKLYVPSEVPYAPSGSPGSQSWSYDPDKLPNVVELDPTDPNYSKLVFTVEFNDGEAW